MFVVSYFSTYLRSRMSNFKPGHTKVILQKWTNRCNKFVSNLIIPNRGRRGNGMRGGVKRGMGSSG